GGLHRRGGRRAPDGVPESLLPWRLRVRAPQCRALSRGPQRAARGVGPLAPTRQLGRNPSLPAGLHIGTAAPALHPLRDPRADPRGVRAGHHLLGAVEPPYLLPARLAPPPPAPDRSRSATERRRGISE